MTPTDKYLLVFVSLATVTGPATLEDARTGDRAIVPAGETWTSNGWETK
jgi:hypothetical protein